jgi:hypothetical protein
VATYLLANALTGAVIDEVPFSTFRFDEVLNRPGGWDATLGMRHAKAIRGNFEPGATSVWAIEGSTVLFGGILWVVGAATGRDTVRVGGQGFLSLYRDGRRSIRSRLGMTHATGPLPSDVRWASSVDLFDIVEDLFAHAAAIGGGADLGLTVSKRGPGALGIAGVGPNGDLELTTDERRPIGELLEQLSKATPGFDFGLSYAWASTNVLVPTLELYYPRRGRITGYVLDAGRNVAIVDWTRDAGTMTNYVEGFGAGEGDAMIRATSTDPSSLAPAGRFPLLEATVNAKPVVDRDYLRGLTAAELGRRNAGLETVKVRTLDSFDVPLGGFIAGDFVTLAATDGILELDGLWRIAGYTASFDSDGQAVADIDLAAAGIYL